MLLDEISQFARGTDPEAAAFRAGYVLLGRLQARGAHVWLLDRPHFGAWAHHCLTSIDKGGTEGFGHFAGMAAAAAIYSGTPFDLDVPVRDGRVLLPGLGFIQVARDLTRIRLRCDGYRVTAGDCFESGRGLLVPDSGSGPPTPGWLGTPMVRATAGGLSWEVLLDTQDPYFDIYAMPKLTALSAGELTKWRTRIRQAWKILVSRHRWAAAPIADAISVIVPLATEHKTDRVSATSPAAFGVIAASCPPGQVAMAETLIHEFQHIKLGALMTLVPLTEPSEVLEYAPWRTDPRPADVLLQGIYAHVGMTRFWRAQRDAETDPDGMLCAQTQYARWRSAIEPTAHAMTRAGCLTALGQRFLERLCVQAASLASDSVPDKAERMAREAALDHQLTWQLRNQAIDAAAAADLARAYQRAEPAAGRELPVSWIQEDVRAVEADLRSWLLVIRYLTPARYRKKLKKVTKKADRADILLLAGKSAKAIEAYRSRIADSADPQPASWIGLALALHQLPDSPLADTFATQLALMFDIHGYLDGPSGLRDPLNLARWLI